LRPWRRHSSPYPCYATALIFPEECEEILNDVILENELDLGNDEVFEPLDIMNMPVVLDDCEPNSLCNGPPINETQITNISQINNL